MATSDITTEDLQRFWSKVAITANPDKCWEWQATKPNGYGMFRLQGKYRLAHRLSWQIANGVIPDGLDILHSCDNPACVNPKHLKPGTHLQNMQDRNAKGRQAHVRGENHGYHKLSDKEVETIRDLYAVGNVSQRAIASQMNVGQTQVWRILNGKSRVEQ